MKSINEIVIQTNQQTKRIQPNFTEIFLSIAGFLKEILEKEDLIISFDVCSKNEQNYWRNFQYEAVAFMDAGTISPFSRFSSPQVIRSASITFNLKKNKFNEREKIIDDQQRVFDLFDQQTTLFDEEGDEKFEAELLEKKKDAARISFELSTLLKTLNKFGEKLDFCYSHGPLSSPVMNFSDLPSFKSSVFKDLMDNKKINAFEPKNRHFIKLSFELLNQIKKSEVPVYGIIEKSFSRLYSRQLLQTLAKKNSINFEKAEKIIETMKNYSIYDTDLFDFILKPDQGIKPIKIKKQKTLAFSLNYNCYENIIKNFPSVFSGFIKSSNSKPFRVESLNEPRNLKKEYEHILFQSRICPNYNFPFGLLAVDHFVRVPAWTKKIISKVSEQNFFDDVQGDKEKMLLGFQLFNSKNRNWHQRPTMRGGGVL